MQQTLSEIRDNLVSAEHQSDAEVLNYSNNFDPVVPSTPFNWNDLYYYVSLQGLESTQSFSNTIANDLVQNYLYERYKETGDSFRKDYCQD